MDGGLVGKFAAIAAIQKDVNGCMQLPSRRPDSKDWRAVYKALRDPTYRAFPFITMVCRISVSNLTNFKLWFSPKYQLYSTAWVNFGWLFGYLSISFFFLALDDRWRYWLLLTSQMVSGKSRCLRLAHPIWDHGFMGCTDWDLSKVTLSAAWSGMRWMSFHEFSIYIHKLYIYTYQNVALLERDA